MINDAGWWWCVYMCMLLYQPFDFHPHSVPEIVYECIFRLVAIATPSDICYSNGIGYDHWRVVWVIDRDKCEYFFSRFYLLLGYSPRQHRYPGRLVNTRTAFYAQREWCNIKKESRNFFTLYCCATEEKNVLSLSWWIYMVSATDKFTGYLCRIHWVINPCVSFCCDGSKVHMILILLLSQNHF